MIYYFFSKKKTKKLVELMKSRLYYIRRYCMILKRLETQFLVEIFISRPRIAIIIVRQALCS